MDHAGLKSLLVVGAAAAMVALPFILRQPADAGPWRPGDPVLVVISPHNEAIRQEFGAAFSRWHEQHHGTPVKVDWRVIGGTTEIMRYLAAEYVGSMRAWWERQGHDWPAGGADWMLDRDFDPEALPAGADGRRRRELYLAFRTNDSPAAATARIDILFGGGAYDHEKAAAQGLAVAPWPTPAAVPPGIFADARGRELIPAGMSGEVWRGETFFGTVLSTFGICFNPDRLRDLGIATPPRGWKDLADPAYSGQVGVTDPTKSGSVAKAFEMIIQQACWETVRAAGYSPADVTGWEARIAAAELPPGELPPGVPPDYQRAVEQGWLAGINRVRLIGANARYFTDAAGKVPIDVGAGAAAAGVAIDFYGRFQAEYTRGADGRPRMTYITPAGGSSVSADPVSLLRGAPHRELAVRFILFVLGEEGQKLWNYRPGEPGGPRRYALRRLPIRRDFYPADDPEFMRACREHARHTSDDLADPSIDPFRLAESFSYQARWTGAHFGIQRDLVRALCLDSGEELRAAWKAVIARGGPARRPAAMERLLALPVTPAPVTWRSALTVYAGADRLEYMSAWTAEARRNYRAAARLARSDAP
jgi:iron(III) transport system substrate-binding protein